MTVNTSSAVAYRQILEASTFQLPIGIIPRAARLLGLWLFCSDSILPTGTPFFFAVHCLSAIRFPNLELLLPISVLHVIPLILTTLFSGRGFMERSIRSADLIKLSEFNTQHLVLRVVARPQLPTTYVSGSCFMTIFILCLGTTSDFCSPSFSKSYTINIIQLLRYLLSMPARGYGWLVDMSGGTRMCEPRAT